MTNGNVTWRSFIIVLLSIMGLISSVVAFQWSTILANDRTREEGDRELQMFIVSTQEKTNTKLEILYDKLEKQDEKQTEILVAIAKLEVKIDDNGTKQRKN